MMDAETAMELVKKGATLLLLNVPQHTLIGVDTQVFTAGPKFCGIKMIPPGPHFIYYSAADRAGNTFSPITGFFIDASASQVIVRKWNGTEEKLVKLLEDEEERYYTAVKKFEFDQQLGPYALEHFREWKQISGYINKDVIKRIEPVGGEISIIYESELLDTNPKTTMEKRLLEQLKYDGKFRCSVEESCKRRCYYTSIPSAVKRKGISGEELTAMNLDKTKLLESILFKDFGGAEDMLLGELQFAFIAFLMGQSLEAFFQWKALVTLLLGCTDAPFHTRSQLYVKFIKVLYFQLKHGFCKKDGSATSSERGASVLLDDSWLSMNNFLYHLCKDFFSIVEEASVVDGDLLTWVKKAKELLETNLGWNFETKYSAGMDMGDDEYAPVIEMIEEPSASNDKF
ncbi:uncharacterized protein LOC116246788 [Nymphaea colorata]|nr:uncharacterized protein LOC116246788 [Nymphaea colorata]